MDPTGCELNPQNPASHSTPSAMFKNLQNMVVFITSTSWPSRQVFNFIPTFSSPFFLCFYYWWILIESFSLKFRMWCSSSLHQPSFPSFVWSISQMSKCHHLPKQHLVGRSSSSWPNGVGMFNRRPIFVLILVSSMALPSERDVGVTI